MKDMVPVRPENQRRKANEQQAKRILENDTLFEKPNNVNQRLKQTTNKKLLIKEYEALELLEKNNKPLTNQEKQKISNQVNKMQPTQVLKELKQIRDSMNNIE